MEQNVYNRVENGKDKGSVKVKPTKTAQKAKKSIKEPKINFDLGECSKITDNALTVLSKRYFKKDAEGNTIETVQEMFKRVAVNIASGDLHFDPKADIAPIASDFYEMMTSQDFLPNSPTLMNAGRELQQLSACFVLPVADSMEEIFETIKHTALIHKSGGGTGFSFSRLRPSGDIVGSTSGVSSGPISFMNVFDGATEAIKQGGTRRGANMGILRVDHPDVLKFIDCKADNDKLNNFNISITMTEEFMEAVKADTEYDLKTPRDGSKAGSLKAREVFERIVKGAWKNGEPGIVFIDRINRDNPTPLVGEMESTNPCGEQPLLPYESCNLGSINLGNMLKKDGKDDFEVDWDKLRSTTHKAVHFLDNVIEMNKYPIPQIDEMTKANRKIGVGVMGFADALIRLGISYNSEEGQNYAEEVMCFINNETKVASRSLAKTRGAFPNFEGSIFDDGKNDPMRNATTTTIAPTGTISIIGNCSGGVEPLFALVYTRNVMDGTRMLEINPIFEEMAKERGFYSKELMEEIAEKGGLHDIQGVPEDIKKVFVVSHDIKPVDHVKMQAAIQRHTDNAVSKTVNFPHDATEEEVAEVYFLAYELGCKGVTVYRDGSRDEQVLSVGTTVKGSEATSIAAPGTATAIRPRGEVAFGVTKKVMTGCGNLYVTVNEDAAGRPLEIFTQMGKAGGCAASQCEAIGRMASLSLRSGIEVREIVDQVKGIRCHLPAGFGANKVTSCADAMGHAVEWYIGYKNSTGQSHILGGGDGGVDIDGAHNFTAATIGDDMSSSESAYIEASGACPDCGGTVEHADGCVVCRGCGYSECG